MSRRWVPYPGGPRKHAAAGTSATSLSDPGRTDRRHVESGRRRQSSLRFSAELDAGVTSGNCRAGT